MSTIDQRMESFVAHIGEVPPDARRLADFEAHEHRAQWVRRVLGQGICSYVIGYTLADRWWTFCFERPSAFDAAEDASPADDVEAWSVEAYDSDGHSWTETFWYDSLEGHWHRKGKSAPLPDASAHVPPMAK